jgi:hypothetical protein
MSETVEKSEQVTYEGGEVKSITRSRTEMHVDSVTLGKVDEILCRVYPTGRGGDVIEKAEFVVRMVINAGNYIRNLDPLVFEQLTKDAPPIVRLEGPDGRAVVIGGEPNEQTVKSYTVGAAKDRAAAVRWLAQNPDVWSDRPSDTFDAKTDAFEAEKSWSLRVLQRLCNEGFDLGSGGLNELLREAKELRANA